MKRSIICVLSLALAVLATGCSHNAAVLQFGKVFKVGGNDYGFVNYINGISIVGVCRENTTLEIEVDDEAGMSYDQNSHSLKGVRKITFAVGPQITGYACDMAKVSPETVTEYFKGVNDGNGDKKASVSSEEKNK